MQSLYTLRNRVIPTYCLLSECYSNSPLAISVALQFLKLCRPKLPDVSEFLIDFWSIALNWNPVRGSVSLCSKQMWEGGVFGLTFRNSKMDQTWYKMECGWPKMMRVCPNVSWAFECELYHNKIAMYTGNNSKSVMPLTIPTSTQSTGHFACAQLPAKYVPNPLFCPPVLSVNYWKVCPISKWPKL